jgi:non-specific protein-tyrosine kinase
VDLRHQLAFLRSSIPLMAIGAIVGAVAAFLVSSALPPSYQAQVTVFVGQAANPGTAADYNQLLISQRLSQTYAQLVTLPSIATGVIKDLNLTTTPEDLLKHVRADSPLDSTLLTITADDTTADGAARIANAFVAELLKSPVASTATPTDMQNLIHEDLVAVQAQAQQVQAQITALVAISSRTDAQDQRLADLQAQMIGLRQTLATLLSLSAGPSVNQLTVVNPARPPSAPSSPRVALNTALGGLLGLLAGIGIGYTRRRLDDTIKTPEDIELVTGLPLLGTIVRMPGDKGRALRYRLATLLYPRSPAAEGFRHLRTNVEFANDETPLRSLLIASAVPGEGKTVTAANLAVAFAQAGRTTCLVDADLRRPTVHELFSLPNEYGLASLLRGEESTYESVTHETEVPKLRVLTTGPLPSNPAELLASRRMRAILTSLLERVELVILDSPPLQAVTDAAILSSLVDGTILVTASGRTRRGSLLRGRDALQRVGARVLGVMLNGVSEDQDSGTSFAYFGYYGQAGTIPAERDVEPSSVFPSAPGGNGRRVAAENDRGNGPRDVSERTTGAGTGSPPSRPVSVPTPAARPQPPAAEKPAVPAAALPTPRLEPVKNPAPSGRGRATRRPPSERPKTSA